MYDVIVIGGGPGGYASSIRASQLGAKVALVEAAEIGGTCVNRGCIPSKVWLRAATVLKTLRTCGDFGIIASVEGVNFQALVDRKNGVSADIRMGMEALLKNNRVDLIRARARLKSPGEVAAGDRTLQGRKVIIAAGGTISRPGIPGMEQVSLTTNEVFDLTELPSPVIIPGSGPIEVEMAGLLNRFGCRTTVLFEGPRILPKEDLETSQRISQAMREQGVELIPRSRIREVMKSEIGFECLITGPEERSIQAEKVLLCGRKPNLGDMGLEEIGLDLEEEGGIRVNPFLESSVEGIYAVGDITGGVMLSHMASSMGIIAAENALGKRSRFQFHLVPRGIWSFPQVGAVGLSEEQAEKTGREIRTGSFPYSINGLAMVEGETTGAVKIVSDARTGEILGIHVVGAHATELVGEAVTAMQLESTTGELARSVRPHPTYSEIVVDAARDTLDWALYLPRRS
jgi:dihydrolipoamide dehydrogenase